MNQDFDNGGWEELFVSRVVLPEVGTRVLLMGSHPWADHFGTVTSHDEKTGKPGAVVQLEDRDHRCYVFNAAQWRAV